MALGAAVVLAYTRFAFFRNGVNAIFSFLRTAVIGTINFVRSHWPLILTLLIGPFGIIIVLITKHWGTIRSRTTGAITGILNWIRTRWRTVVSIFSLPLQAVIALFTGRWGKLQQITNQMAAAILGKIRSLMSGARNAFSSGVTAIASAWGRVRDAAKKPINFVIGTVYNRGIVGLWNKVMGWLHLPGSLKLGTLPLLASGGPMPVRPGVFNRPTAIVGEGNQNHPEYVIPTDPKYRGRAQALWAAAGQQMQMMDIGGVLGGIKKAAGKVVNVGKMAFDLITNPGKVWDKLVQVVPSANSLRTSPFGIAAAEMPNLILRYAKDYAVKFFKAFSSGFGGGGKGAVAQAARRYIGTRYLWGGTDLSGIDCSGLVMRAWLDGVRKNVTRTTSTQHAFMKSIPRPIVGAAGQPHSGHTYLASRINPTYVIEAAHSGTRVSEHRLTRNTPWWGYPPGMALGGVMSRMGKGFVNGTRSALAAKIFGLAGDPGGVLPGYGPIQKNFFPGGGSSGNMAMDLVSALGFDKPLFDTGGLGVGWPFHSRTPEPVLTGTQWTDIHELAKRGSKPNVTVNLHGVSGVPSEKQITNAIDNLFTLHGRW